MCYNIIEGIGMKSEVVHARVDSDVKMKAEKILEPIGITISQAFDLFLRQVILKNGIPFKLDNKEEKPTDLEKLAYIMNSTDGIEPSAKAKKIIHLYAKGDIDLETAKYALMKG